MRSKSVGTLSKALAAASVLGLAAFARASGDADRVVILANATDPDSTAIALHYARARKVPAANVISLAMPVSEVVTWKEFVATIWGPLEEQLVARGWIDAIAMDLKDDVGRRKYAVSGHRIAALVVCRGVPLKVMNDPALSQEVRPMTDHPQFRTNAGAVDSELSLLAQPGYPINAGVPNPLFDNPEPSDQARSQVVKVSRLDGPTAADAMGLVDRALEAERTGLLGRAYVDIAGPHENGDRWLESVAARLRDLGFDLSVSRGKETLGEAARFDAPVLYFGWYTPNLNGPFSLPGFRFPPGAVAIHIHSFSASTLRSATEGWSGPLVARGVTATVGNVYEPYLEFVHRPDLMLEALARGDDLVDAAYFALPILSWQSIVVGDPLYRPFAVPLSAQMAGFSKLPQALAGYAVVRRMMELDLAGDKVAAIEAGKEGMKAAPSLALALALAQRYEASGMHEGAVWLVKEAAENSGVAAGDWALLHEAAVFLAGHGRAAEALDVYQKLFLVDALPGAVRLAWLGDARRVALDSGDTGQAAEWDEQRTLLLKGAPAGL